MDYFYHVEKMVQHNLFCELCSNGRSKTLYEMVHWKKGKPKGGLLKWSWLLFPFGLLQMRIFCIDPLLPKGFSQGVQRLAPPDIDVQALVLASDYNLLFSSWRNWEKLYLYTTLKVRFWLPLFVKTTFCSCLLVSFIHSVNIYCLLPMCQALC